MVPQVVAPGVVAVGSLGHGVAGEHDPLGFAHGALLRFVLGFAGVGAGRRPVSDGTDDQQYQSDGSADQEWTWASLESAHLFGWMPASRARCGGSTRLLSRLPSGVGRAPVRRRSRAAGPGRPGVRGG